MIELTPDGPVFAKQPAGVLTNSSLLANRLDETCANEHGHAAFQRGKVLQAPSFFFSQTYPFQRCEATCRGIRDQKEVDVARSFHIGIVDFVLGACVHEFLNNSETLHCEEACHRAWVDVAGEVFILQLGWQVRKKEYDHCRNMDV